MALQSAVESFLGDFKRRALRADPERAGVRAGDLYLARPGVKVEVAVFHADHRPRADDVRAAWRSQQANRATGVLAVVLYEADGVAQGACAGLWDSDAVRHLPLSLIEPHVTQVLEAETDSAAGHAVETLLAQDPSLASIPGLVNQGLFSTHELMINVPADKDRWEGAQARSAALRGMHGEDMLRALGWHVTPQGQDLVLTLPDGPDAGRERAYAVFLRGDEVFERPSNVRGGTMSPVEHALNAARNRNLTWVLVMQGNRVRLYSADPDTGLARRGAATYTELGLDLLAGTDRLAYAWLMLSAESLGGGGVERLLQDSADHASGVGERLRERVYDDVVPSLAEDVARSLTDLTAKGLSEAYHVTTVVLFRLIFVAYAEDAGLLPYRVNQNYTSRALKTRSRELADRVGSGDGGRLLDADFDDEATDLWDSVQQVWSAVRRGHAEWGVPAYGGSLFREDGRIGDLIARLRLTNAQFGPPLAALLVDGEGEERGPVDFQDLSVREFGTIYEGLLESSLSLAPSDLSLDADGTYAPAGETGDVQVPAGSVYFHNASGVRKATGSYFTKPFAVEHLLRRALDPTLDEHLAGVRLLLDEGRHADAAKEFFAFRVADIAMGSGHFLVGAVDHIAAKLAAFLEENPLPAVTAELEHLRDVASEQMRAAGIQEQIQQESLLRRQVAKRCIYGVDINEVAVDLARLGLWIHTFVPGLPMSSLEHGLAHGNALTGIATVEEALEALAGITERSGFVQGSVFEEPLREPLANAAAILDRVALTAEATAAESDAAARAYAEAQDMASEARGIFNAAVAVRLGLIAREDAFDPHQLPEIVARDAVAERLQELAPLHFPARFPEVFRPGLESTGFHVVLGNPPWEKVKIEEHGWWADRFPGLRSMAQGKRKAMIRQYRQDRPDLVKQYEADLASTDEWRRVYKAGPYDLGTGDTDLSKIFAWRDWELLRANGRAGLVLPRPSLSGSGSTPWRLDVLEKGGFDEVCFLTNSRHWAFEDVHPQWTIALAVLRRGDVSKLAFSGPFHSRREYDEKHYEVTVVTRREFTSWSSVAAFPLLPNAQSAELFLRMRSHGRLDARIDFDFRPVVELHGTKDQALLDLGGKTTGAEFIEVFTGGSFNLWDPNFGAPYALARRGEVVEFLRAKRLRQLRLARSAYFGVPFMASQPLEAARIAFRDVTRATDNRTVIASLLPPGVTPIHKAPFLLRRAGSSLDEAYLLGILSSIPLDWYARRYVELTLSYEILNALPIPRPAEASPWRKRLVEVAGRLAAVDERYADWAEQVGVPVGSANDPQMKDELIDEVDALVGLLYGLTREDMGLIFETFHRGWDYEPRLAAVLAHYDRWADA